MENVEPVIVVKEVGVNVLPLVVGVLVKSTVIPPNVLIP